MKNGDSFQRATSNGFHGREHTKSLFLPADIVYTWTPDNSSIQVWLKAIIALIEKRRDFGYSHGFNIVEEGPKNSVATITLVMCWLLNVLVPKCVRVFKRGFWSTNL